MNRDAEFMCRALELARMSAGATRPNPPVGAVVVCCGEIIGEGRHLACGGPHAEVEALADCARRGKDAHGATVYVSLEPCSKPGRVGACTDALIAAGVRRVVWAAADPNPKNANRAARVLGDAGIDTSFGVLAREAEEIIRPFKKHILTGLPYLTVKIAMSLDGKICDNAGSARWISSEESRKETGALRNSVDAILVGAQTVRADDPRLLPYGETQNKVWRVVVTHSGDLPENARIFTDEAKERTLIYRNIALKDMMADLGARGFLHVLCEGGLNLARQLAHEGLVDEWIGVLAPVVIGEHPLANCVRFEGKDVIARWRCSLD
ncbi:MAG: bifunctional diaminohydroxyphosphoribosylaminopyrimidine deaminase/5-amino-6-(5-phosphoribosylamino)uracil reductase RibD [Kiritimatiellae bacterium]|nr:bifunctional diaminohydroxyphosphoribosylaminopyrimidine deaminase/5-amino-6-(5-phosphoribosylamino)uracil reductase RibD [Kiritimatiellia bacterium]